MSEYIEKEWQACKMSEGAEPMTLEELIGQFTLMIEDGYKQTGKYDFFYVNAEHADGGDVAICATGNGPNSKYHAQAIAALPDALRQLTTLTQRISELEAERKWISVEDRLPEAIEGNKVLGFGGGFERGYAFECEFEDGWWCNLGGETMTHWQPLPSPPTVRGSE